MAQLSLHMERSGERQPVTPWPHQELSYNKTIGAYNRGLRAVVNTMATGTGKSIPISKLVEAASRNRKRKVIALAHRENLIGQLREHIQRNVPDRAVTVEMGSNHADPSADIIVASVPTLGRKGTSRLQAIAEHGASLIVIDEVHHSGSATYQNIGERFGRWNPDSRTLWAGFTATMKPLTDIVGENGKPFWQEEVYTYGILQAIRDQYLVPIKAITVKSGIDITKLSHRTGDYSLNELSEELDIDARNHLAAESWAENGQFRKTLVHCTSINHAAHAAEAFRKVGAKADWVSGEPHLLVDGNMSDGMTKEERHRRLERWMKSDDTEVMCHCDLLLEGFDFPGISCVVWLRPTESWTIYMQGTGRGTRLCKATGLWFGIGGSIDKEDLLVLDVVDNCTKHTVTMPSIVGLPNTFNMDGEDITDLSEKASKAKSEGKNLLKLEDIKDFDRIEKEVDIFGGQSQFPDEVVNGSSLAWMKSSKGYLIVAPDPAPYDRPYSEALTKRVARLEWNSQGFWETTFYVDGSPMQRAPCGEGIIPDFKAADNVVLDQWRHKAAVLKRSNKGKGKPLSPVQKGRLTRLGIPKSEQANFDALTARLAINMGEQTGWRYGQEVK